MIKSKPTVFLLFVVFVFQGCHLNDDHPDPNDRQVLVSYSKIQTSAILQLVLDQILSLSHEFDDQVIQNLTQFNFNIYKVVYKTTYRGVEKQASGACIIPETNGVAVPIASYQHGTIFHENKIPSNFTNIFDVNMVEMLLPQAVSSCGFICAVPDYIGYGASGDVIHPYHHQESTANACVDMLRAVKEMCQELNVNFQEKYFLFGYSEGGYATLAALKKLQAEYAGQFPITACAAGAGAYDLSNTIVWYLQQQTISGPAFLAFVFAAYKDVYGWNRSLCEIFKNPYCDRIAAGLFDGSHSEDQVSGQLTSQTQDLFASTFLADFFGNGEQTVKAALLENSVYLGWFPTCPTRLYQGTADKIVPPFNASNAKNAFMAAGGTAVTYYPLNGLTHETAAIPCFKDMIQWFKSF
ncbi:MAG: prolyl oligopeptidase family serine peptidase [Candidatus Aminicenantes bacterium]|nr:prolyl oligopeptidase family serine peptidase [Candidatus Aminicenantes bacterium]